jgi:hypothetical protein
MNLLQPEAIAPMVVRAIINDRPLIFDHADQRQVWLDTYQRPVLDAFDAIAAEERRSQDSLL